MKTILVNDKMQRGYSYQLTARTGYVHGDLFQPHFTPAQMLRLGVFEGKYMNDCRDEFPKAWFDKARTSDVADSLINHFGVKSRSPLSEWQDKGWIDECDPRGWFQWYCRYYMGRRIQAVDERQIKRWRAFVRHAGQIRANCEPGDKDCRPRQRQALLQWSHNPFI